LFSWRAAQAAAQLGGGPVRLRGGRRRGSHEPMRGENGALRSEDGRRDGKAQSSKLAARGPRGLGGAVGFT